MLFLGHSFFGGRNTLDSTPVKTESKSITIGNGMYDELYGTRNTNEDFYNIEKKWDYDTILHALFNGNLVAGNINFTMNSVSSIRIKCKEHNSHKWKTIIEIPISSREDFNFERIYSYCKNKIKYDFAFVPVINGIEGNLNINTIESKFEGVYLIDKDTSFHAYLDTKLTSERNQVDSVIQPLGRKYPYYIKNGQANHEQGTLQATFININRSICKLDIEGGFEYRKKLDDFLTNGKAKILKSDDGRIWIVATVGVITQDIDKVKELPKHVINWTETADINSIGDLYDNNFIDTDVDRE